MVTRPLELSRRLRPAPANFDVLFYVNGALIAVFFLMFGSPFVLAPGITLPAHSNRSVTMFGTNAVVSVKASGQIFVDRLGVITKEQLKDWLHEQAKRTPNAVLLVRADAGISLQVQAEIHQLAITAGFTDVQIAHKEAASAS